MEVASEPEVAAEPVLAPEVVAEPEAVPEVAVVAVVPDNRIVVVVKVAELVLENDRIKCR